MDTNLYLVGFMDTGKSTVGRLVARQMGFEFVDNLIFDGLLALAALGFA